MRRSEVLNEGQEATRMQLQHTGGLVGLLSSTLVGILLVLGGQPVAFAGEYLVIWLALGIPLVAGGYLYDHLGEQGRLRKAYLFHAMVFWMIAFPLCRLFQDLAVGVVVRLVTGPAVGVFPYYLSSPADILGFVVYQSIVGSAYGMGFLMLHGRLTSLFGWVRKYRNG